MDDIERAERASRQMLIAHLSHPYRPVTKAVATGYCLNCDEMMLYLEQKFCDSDCEDDWRKRNHVSR